MIEIGSAPRAKTVSAPTTLLERIEIAAETACQRPFVRDLSGCKAYEECLTGTRAEIEAQLAKADDREVTELAAR